MIKSAKRKKNTKQNTKFTFIDQCGFPDQGNPHLIYILLYMSLVMIQITKE